MRYISVFIGFSFILLAIGCKKSPELETEYAPIFNRSVDVYVSEKQISFKATYTQFNTSITEKCGFEWSEQDGSNTVIFTVGKPGSGEISMQIDTALRESNRYKIRAWVKVGEKFCYSKYVSFAGMGFPPPEITSLNKKYFYWGEDVTINGKYFTYDHFNGEIEVKIDDIQCPVSFASYNKIIVQMPFSTYSGKLKLSLKVLGKYTLKETEIENYRPEISSVTFQSMTGNGEIIVKGKFHSEYNQFVIPVQNDESYFPYTEYKIEKYSDDEIILKRGQYMFCEPKYNICFKLRKFGSNEIDYLKTGFSVKRTGNWSRLNNTPFSSFDKALTLNGMGYVIQFQGQTGSFPLWRYNPKSDQWTKLASFPGGFRFDPVFLECNGFIYCGLGKVDQYYTLLNDFWKYDPVRNTWTECAYLKFKSNDGVSIFGANIQDTVYVFSEWNNQKAKYIPASNSWAISDCYVPRLYDHASNFMYNGEYYFFRDMYQNNFYRYNLSTSRFDEIYVNNLDRAGGFAFLYKGRVFTMFCCYLSEIDMVNISVNELYDYFDNVNLDRASWPIFVIGDKTYFFFQPNGMSALYIE
jgi:hypothetical protein